MFKRDDIVMAHRWTGKYSQFNGDAVRIVGSLRMRESRRQDGTTAKLEAYEVLAPNGERLIASPENLIALYEPIYRFRMDLQVVTWGECHWSPKEFWSGEDGLDPNDFP